MTLLHRLCFAGGLSVVLLCGCDPKESSLGELPESETESDTDLDSEDMSDSDSTSSEEVSVVGLQCDLSQQAQGSLLEDDQSNTCNGGYCLYADTFQAPIQTCESDEGCGSEDGRLYCDPESGECALNPDFAAARSMCSQNCETADDCIGADGTACEGGFSCAPIASLGSLCCQSVCVCNEDLDTAAADELRQECEQSTVAGCCDQATPGPGCG